MDFDDDGILDFISGSYDPGDLYLFRGLGDGRYAAVELLRDADGVPLVHHPEQLKEYQRLSGQKDADDDKSIQARIASFGSWPATVDWDGDGDLDLLIGSFSGEVWLRINEGTRAVPSFSPTSERIDAGGASIKVTGHANPAVADWDNDGRWDLVVSSSDGSVGWYQNSGTATKPTLGARRLLVEAKAENKFLKRTLEAGDPVTPGVRAQICVTDYDGDGWLDLVLGDFQSIERLRTLSDEERAEYDALVAREAEVGSRFEDADDASMDAIQAELESIADEKRAYLEGPKAKSQMGPIHSFVWLFRRIPS